VKPGSDLIQFLSFFESGTLSIRLNGFSLFKVDAESRIVEVEASEMKEYGLRLTKLTEVQTGQKGWRSMLKGTMSIAKELHNRGWMFKLYDGKECIVTMGQGVSRLSGYIGLNPLKIRRILKYL
jgi:hypothetical protein